MATQSSEQRSSGGWSKTALTDGDGFSYHSKAGDTTSPRCYEGDGTPNAIITAPLGSEYKDWVTGYDYRNTDGSTTWQKVTTA